MTEEPSGDHIDVGNIQNAQGIAIGRQARAVVTGSLVSGGADVDADALRAVLKQLRTALGQVDLPDDTVIAAQTAAGSALVDGVKSDGVDAEAVVKNVIRTAEVLKNANSAVQEGTTLWQSVQKLAVVLGPLVSGGASAIAAWFGMSFPF